MKGKFAYTGLLVLLLFASLSLLTVAEAQSGPLVSKSVRAQEYNAANEVTLSATVTAVPTRTANGAFAAKTVKLQTSAGTVDANLGRAAIRGKYALPLSAGKQMQVTGVMTTHSNAQVFLVRSVKLDGHTYTLRNEHGFALMRPVVDGVVPASFKGGVR